MSRVISFKQSTDEPKYSYTLADIPLTIGCYYYNRKLGAFFAVQCCLHDSQLAWNYPVIISTDNPRYQLTEVKPIESDNALIRSLYK